MPNNHVSNHIKIKRAHAAYAKSMESRIAKMSDKELRRAVARLAATVQAQDYIFTRLLRIQDIQEQLLSDSATKEWLTIYKRQMKRLAR